MAFVPPPHLFYYIVNDDIKVTHAVFYYIFFRAIEIYIGERGVISKYYISMKRNFIIGNEMKILSIDKIISKTLKRHFQNTNISHARFPNRSEEYITYNISTYSLTKKYRSITIIKPFFYQL